MNFQKLLQRTFSISLIVLLLSGYSRIDAQPKGGDWSAPADFGQLEFTVNSNGTEITRIKRIYSSYTCGIATMGGAMTSYGSWPISNNQFTYETQDWLSGDSFTLNGTFTGNGENVSGTFSQTVSGTICTGNWGPAVWLLTEIDSGIPGRYIMAQNYPNPFNPNTAIYYSLPNESAVTITVYDMLGKEINQLISQKQPSGKHSIQWNGTDCDGNPVSAGIYLYQIQAGDFVQSKKMVLMK